MRAIFSLCLLLVLTLQVHSHELRFGAIQDLVEQEIGKEVLPKIYEKLNEEIKIVSMPAVKAESQLSLGFLDGEIMRIESYGNGNDRVIRVPTPYYQLQTMAFVNKNSGITIKNLDDLKKYRVAIVKGVKHTANATKGHPKLVYLLNTKQILKLLEKGRVDVALTSTIDGLVAISNLGLENVTPMDRPLATEPLYHYLHKSNEDMVPKVDKVIQQMTESGELNTLVRQAELIVTAGAN